MLYEITYLSKYYISPGHCLESATLYQFEARTRRTGDRVRIDRGISPG